jgi:hypothetical protein
MQSAASTRLRRIANSLMLLAMLAFLQQGTMIALSQAGAALGFMPQPAVTLHGALHLHDNLAGHVHAHGGVYAVGHVHGSADPDNDHADDVAKAPLYSIACTAAVVPVPGACAVAVATGAVEWLQRTLLDGVEPDGLSRPPSIPSIA